MIYLVHTNRRYVMDKKYIDRLHEEMKYVCCRINAQKSRGSGTVLYSKPTANDPSVFSSYVLTNHHVVEDSIEVKEEWSGLLKRNIKTDVLAEVHVDFFEWEYLSWEGTEKTMRAEIKAYDKNMDLALLKLKTSHKIPYVAKLFPKGEEKKRLNAGMATVVCGAAMGSPVIHTNGQLCYLDVTIDNYPYWMQTAPTIFGNSGGACFLSESAEFIGVPARIAVAMMGFGADAITHMSYIIPILTVRNFLDKNIFEFIYDENKTEEECEKRRLEKKEEDMKKLFVRAERGEPDK